MSWLRKKDPVVNAIMRGVYFKDPPVDLDEGKYKNRLTLLKVPRLTKERILRVSPEINYVISENNQINPTKNLTYDLIASKDLYDQLIIRVHKKIGVTTYFDLNVRLMTLEGGDVIYETNIIFTGESQTKTISFPATHNIHLDISNNAAKYALIDYTFAFSEVIYPNLPKLHSKLQENTAITRYFKDSLTYFNSAVIEFKNTGILDLVITLKTFNILLTDQTLFTETIVAGATFYKLIEFDAANSVKLILDNKHLTLDLYFSIYFFFSKNLKSELDDLKKALLIGEANAEFIPCTFIGGNDYARWGWSGQSVGNTSSTNDDWRFQLPLPLQRGGKGLHIKQVLIHLKAANASNYITQTIIYDGAYNGSNALFTNNDNRTSPSANDATYLNNVNLNVSGANEHMIVELSTFVATAWNLLCSGVYLKCYYA